MKITKQQTVKEVLDEAYELICNRLDEIGIKYDSSNDDVIFYNDDRQRKTFAINLMQKQCCEYEGKED